MKLRLMVFAFCLAITAMANEAYEIGSAMLSDDFWKQDPVLFVRNHQSDAGLKFTSDTRETADSRMDGGVTFHGLEVYETRVKFSSDPAGIERVELSLYNPSGTEAIHVLENTDGKKFRRIARENKTMSRKDFMAVLEQVRTVFSKGTKPPKPVADRVKKGTTQKTQTWKNGNELVWNFTQDGNNEATFSPGFIRVTMLSPDAQRSAKSKTAKGAKSITDNIIKDPRGDVFIDNVPMVDQGQKGYCAVATSERVLRYYGIDIDEHELADAAGSKAEGGTSTREMKNAVENIGKRYRLGTVVSYGEFDKPSAERIAGLQKEVRAYNKAAKKLKKREIVDSDYITHEGNTTWFHYSKVDELSDAEVLKEMKCNGPQKSKYTKFMKDIHQQIDKGIPLFWGVKLGLYPETDLPQTRGGHMRLIIGYNDKKKEILYTDSWGKGHELKRMPADWAWTISYCILYMKPLTK